jgi:hypothetical protein
MSPLERATLPALPRDVAHMAAPPATTIHPTGPAGKDPARPPQHSSAGDLAFRFPSLGDDQYVLLISPRGGGFRLGHNLSSIEF